MPIFLHTCITAPTAFPRTADATAISLLLRSLPSGRATTDSPLTSLRSFLSGLQNPNSVGLYSSRTERHPVSESVLPCRVAEIQFPVSVVLLVADGYACSRQSVSYRNGRLIRLLPSSLCQWLHSPIHADASDVWPRYLSPAPFCIGISRSHEPVRKSIPGSLYSA